MLEGTGVEGGILGQEHIPQELFKFCTLIFEMLSIAI